MLSSLKDLLRHFSTPPLMPLDADPATAIHKAAHKIVAAIKRRREKIEQPDKPLFVLLGETHINPCHHLTHLLVLKALKEKGYKLAVGYEHDYNFATALKGDFDHKILPPACVARNRLNTTSLIQTAEERFQNGLAIGLRAYGIMKLALCASFNDAAHMPGSHDLDEKDGHYIRARAESGLSPHRETTSGVKPKGILIRNTIMQQFASTHAAIEKPEVYIQICGNAHIAGDASDNLAYKTSLLALFEEKGLEVLGIPVFDHKGFSPWHLPAITRTKSEDTLVQDIILPRLKRALDPDNKAWLALMLKAVGLPENWFEEMETFKKTTSPVLRP